MVSKKMENNDLASVFKKLSFVIGFGSFDIIHIMNAPIKLSLSPYLTDLIHFQWELIDILFGHRSFTAQNSTHDDKYIQYTNDTFR